MTQRTTRSKTGSLPAKKVKTTDKAQLVGRDIERITHFQHDTQAVLGEQDKLSHLPLDVLLTLLSFCHPESLVALARTNRTLRALLTSKKSQPVWINARDALTWYRVPTANPQPDWPGQQRWKYARDVSKDAKDAIKYSLPALPPGMSELQYAILVFGQEYFCFYCKEPATSHYYIATMGITVCYPCQRSKFITFSALQRQWKKERDIDARLYDIIPRNRTQVCLEVCTKLKKELFELEARCINNEAEVDAWFTRKRSELYINDSFMDGVHDWQNLNKDAQRESERSRTEVNRRAIAQYWDGFTEDDAEEFFKLGYMAVPAGSTNLQAEATRIMGIGSHKTKLEAIRKVRLDYEKYREQASARACLKQLIEQSMTQEAADAADAAAKATEPAEAPSNKENRDAASAADVEMATSASPIDNSTAHAMSAELAVTQTTESSHTSAATQTAVESRTLEAAEASAASQAPQSPKEPSHADTAENVETVLATIAASTGDILPSSVPHTVDTPAVTFPSNEVAPPSPSPTSLLDQVDAAVVTSASGVISDDMPSASVAPVLPPGDPSQHVTPAGMLTDEQIQAIVATVDLSETGVAPHELVDHISQALAAYRATRTSADNAAAPDAPADASGTLASNEATALQPLVFGTLDNRLPQFMDLVAVKPLLTHLEQGDATSAAMISAWQQQWPAIRAEIVGLQKTWRARMTACLEVYGHEEELDKYWTVFECTSCYASNLRWPALLDHSCFFKVVDDPSFAKSSRSISTQESRPGSINLRHIRLARGGNAKIRRLCTLIADAGGQEPDPQTHEIHGHFVCAKCPDLTYNWTETLAHLDKIVQTVNTEEEDVTVTTRVVHRKITFVPTDEISYTQQTDATPAVVTTTANGHPNLDADDEDMHYTVPFSSFLAGGHGGHHMFDSDSMEGSDDDDFY